MPMVSWWPFRPRGGLFSPVPEILSNECDQDLSDSLGTGVIPVPSQTTLDWEEGATLKSPSAATLVPRARGGTTWFDPCEFMDGEDGDFTLNSLLTFAPKASPNAPTRVEDVGIGTIHALSDPALGSLSQETTNFDEHESATLEGGWRRFPWDFAPVSFFSPQRLIEATPLIPSTRPDARAGPSNSCIYPRFHEHLDSPPPLEDLPYADDCVTLGATQRSGVWVVQPSKASMVDSLNSISPGEVARPCAKSEPAPGTVNVGPHEPLSTLADEFKYNVSFREKVEALKARGYEGWRRIRGDGNCFYRAVGFAMLEQLVTKPHKLRYRWALELISHLEAISPIDPSALGAQNHRHDSEYHDAREKFDGHADLLSRLRRVASGGGWETSQNAVQSKETTPMGALYQSLRDPSSTMDLALVRALRRLVASYIRKYADDERQCNGITFEILCMAEGHDGAAGFIRNVVLPLGKEAEGLILSVLPKALGIDLRVAILDRREAAELSFSDYDAEAKGQQWRPRVHVQLRPGHYDILYFSQDDQGPVNDERSRRPCVRPSTFGMEFEFEAVALTDGRI